MAWVYILVSSQDGERYIGSTTDLKKRVKERNLGFVQSTKPRGPLQLWAYQTCESMEEAADLEKKYKRSSGRIARALKRGELELA